MPPALYAISFKRTGHLLAVCSFESQTLADGDAARALLATLVDRHLEISASSGQPIRVALDELVLDPIKGAAAPADVIANVHGYQVKAAAGGQLGDGSDKQLDAAAVNSVKTLALASDGTLTVTLKNPDAIPHEAWLLFEGAPNPISGVNLTGMSQFTMSVPGPLSTSASYGLVLLKDGIPATAGYLTPT